jgi:hypothetical protein
MVAQPFPHHHSLEIHYSQFRDWQTFSVKSQIVNILGFSGQTVSCVTFNLAVLVKAAKYNT